MFEVEVEVIVRVGDGDGDRYESRAIRALPELPSARTLAEMVRAMGDQQVKGVRDMISPPPVSPGAGAGGSVSYRPPQPPTVVT